MSAIWDIIGSNNGLSPARCQAITWTGAGIVWIALLGTNFSQILIDIENFHSRKCIWKCHLQNLQPFYLSLNVLNIPKQHYQTLPGMWLHFLPVTNSSMTPLCQGWREPTPDKAHLLVIIELKPWKISHWKGLFHRYINHSLCTFILWLKLTMNVS